MNDDLFLFVPGGMVAVGGLVILLAGWFLLRLIRGTTRKKSELAMLSLVADKTDNVVVITGADGLTEWINPAFTRLSGCDSAEALGKTPGSVLLGKLPGARTIEKIKEGMQSREHFTLETLCTHKDGNRYWLSLNFTPVFDDRGGLTHFIGVGTDITAAKRAVDDLARVNRRNELLLNAAGEGIYGVDLQGNISFINPAGGRLTGWQPIELVGQPASVILHQLRLTKRPTGQEDHFAATACKDGSVLIGDFDQFRRKDGAVFPVEYTNTTICEGAHVVGTVVVFRDISDRKQGEVMRGRQARQFALRADVGYALAANDTLPNTLHRSAQAIVKHLEGAFARIWTLSADEKNLELQASAGLYTQLNGHHSRIAVGSTKVGVIARERVPQMTNDLANDPFVSDREWVKREKMIGFVGFPLFVENRLIGVMAMFSRNRLPDDSFEMLGAVADSIAQGIVRKRAEEKVGEQAALLDKAQDAILVMDMEDRVVYWNKSAERLYGWPAKEAYGKRTDELIYRDASYFNRSRQEVMEKGEWRGECCQVTRGDENAIVESQWTLVQDDAGQPKSILLVNTNISEKKSIEAQFLRTQRMESIGTLAGGIAHDLNNVLAPILMSVEILKEKFKDDHSRRMLGVLESSAKRGADMVKQVLTFARGVDGERVLLQTKHLLKEVAKIVSETFPKSIQLRTSIAENLWTTMGDATQLHQVMVNLAVNARDAMPEGGVITLSAENTVIEASQGLNDGRAKPGSYVVIKVSDSGTGIPPEVLDKIFEPFFTTKEMGKGTGLGLATVLGIVKSHGGFVDVQTEVDNGTTFLIYLPALENTAAQAGETGQRKLPVGNGELILAVDDEAAVLTMTKETLETYGYRVLTASDGTEAIAAYSTHRHEIRGVLTDMLMPFMDGPATIRALRKLDPGVKIIAASGLMDSDKVKDSTGMDNLAFLMKPYTAEKLLNTIHKTLAETN